jgi:hypothetical protein
MEALQQRHALRLATLTMQRNAYYKNVIAKEKEKI